MKKLILMGLCSIGLFASTEIKSIDIYKNKTFITQEIDISKKEIRLFSNVKLEDIVFNLPPKCKILNSKLDIRKDDFSKQIIKIEQYIRNLEAQIKSFENSINFFQQISIKDVKSFDKIAKTSSYIHQESLKLYTKIEELKSVQKKYQEKLYELLKKRDSHNVYYLSYEKEGCLGNNQLSLTYGFNSLEKNLFYEIREDSKKKKLFIKKSAFLTQSSGTDFENATINLYSYSFDMRLKPYKFYPKYLDIIESPVLYDASPELMRAKAFKSSIKKSIKRTPTFSYIQSGTKSIFQAKNISLKSGVKTPIIFAHDSYTSSNIIQIDGFSTSKPFYKVQFKTDKSYLPLLAKFYLDGLYIGKKGIEVIKKDEKSILYFGKDEFINVKKELVKDMKEKPFFSINKLISQKVYKYTIENKQNSKKSFELIERIPVSKHEDIKVKLITNKEFTKKENNGKVIYSFSLEPNEKYILEFGYEIEKPSKK